jgi:hypothetical protein
VTAEGDAVRRLEARLDAIDQMGTRGVGGLAVQVQEIAKDVARLEKAMEDHAKAHAAEAAARVSSRRWQVGMAVAVVAAIDGPVMTAVALLLQHVH